MAQRLVRTIDNNYKEEYKPTQGELDLLNISGIAFLGFKIYNIY